MQLEDLVFNVRQRPHWEALDLGILLGRRWFGTLVALWLVTAAPVFGLVFITLSDYPGVAALTCWWLKPLYERMPLKFLSSAVFADAPDLRRAIREGAGAIRPGIGLALTLLRLSPSRSFDAPVFVLEGVEGATRRQRCNVLRPRAGSPALWLTVLGVHIEAFLAIALVVLAVLFLPSGVEVDWLTLFLSGDNLMLAWLLNLVTIGVMSLVAPFYIACGFALYLNRRVELEAWDIELGFRRLASRLAVPAALLLWVMIPLGDLHALQAPVEPEVSVPRVESLDPGEAQWSPARRASREAIAEVLAGSDFHQRSTLRYPKFLDGLFGDGDAADEAEPLDLASLAAIVRVLARVLEVGLWVLLVGALVWIALRARWFDSLARTLARNRPPSHVAGMAVAANSLPENVAAAAEQLWLGGRRRDALSLIYRATLSRLLTCFGCPFRESDTENDCLLRAGRGVPAEVNGFFRELTDVWLRAAYGSQYPEDSSFGDLCGRWVELLEGTHAPG